MKILLVEDDVFLIKALTTKLSKEGIEVLQGKDGEEALVKIKEKPELILLDLMLPKKSGFEVLGEIKRDASLKDIPVIIMSNLGQEDDIKKGIALGAIDYLIKADIKIDDIVAKIKTFKK